MGAARGTLAQRFWRKVEKTPTCWLWRGYQKPSGHGAINKGGECGPPLQAHRVSWEIHNGPIPPGLHVLHKCDVAGCVNPEHLYLGTHQDNMRDMKDRKRCKSNPRFGEDNPFAKLTKAAVCEIRAEYAAGDVSQRKLAVKHGVSQLHISRIVRNLVWRAAA